MTRKTIRSSKSVDKQITDFLNSKKGKEINSIMGKKGKSPTLDFTKRADAAGYTLADLAEIWEVSSSTMDRIAANPKRKDWLALAGLLSLTSENSLK